MQELLPDHLLKEAKAAADKTKGAKVQWPFGWGKKKAADQEPPPSPDPETLKVKACWLLIQCSDNIRPK